MLNAVWVFVGGGLGTLARWGASGFIANRFGQTFHEPGGPRLRRALTDSCGWEIRARRSLAPPFMVQMRDSRTVEASHEPSLHPRPRSHPRPRQDDSFSWPQLTSNLWRCSLSMNRIP